MPQDILFDVFELSGRPTNNSTIYFNGSPDATGVTFGPIVEPMQIDIRSSGLLQRDDSLILDGSPWRITGLAEIGTNKFSGTNPNPAQSSMTLIFVSNGSVERTFALEYDMYASPVYGPTGPMPTTHVGIWSYDSAFYINLSYVRQNDPDHLYQKPSICFAAGTMIETARGPCPVERLRVGDMIRTRDHGLQPLRWLGGRRLSAADLGRAPNLCPIRISAGALGRGMPAQDLTVSPQHRMLVRSPIVTRMTGDDEVLVAAVHLLGLPGVTRLTGAGGVGYWHLMFDAHEIVFANGAEAESLYLGVNAIKALDPAALVELAALFPEIIREGDSRGTARTVLCGRRSKALVQRQLRNGKPMVMPLLTA